MKAKRLLEHLNQFLGSEDFDVVYGTGAFSGGHCVINQNRVIVVNKRMPHEEQIRILVSVILELKLDYSGLKNEVQEYINRYLTG
jgi:hypothetical protein